MSRIARVWVAGICMGAAVASGWASAQLQSGVPRKAQAVEKIGVGVPVVPAVSAKLGMPSAARAVAGSGSRVTFTGGQPAIRYPATDLPGPSDTVAQPVIAAKSASSASSREFAPQPGTQRANLPPVTAADAQRVLVARTLPANLNQGMTSPRVTTPKSSSITRAASTRIGGDAGALGPASIVELARSLRNDPDLIYQYVRNNIEFHSVFGIQKGGLGTLLDNQGTAADQAALMVELLRASGITANYVRGVIRVTAAQMAEWYGIDTSSVCGVLSFLGQSQVPIYEINATAAGSCPGLTAAMTDVSLEHVWVKASIGGTNYVFDPSYKAHTLTTGIDLASPATTGYNAANYLASAQSGATVTGDYVQNINRTNIRNNLTAHATNLASYLRANKPAATLDDVIGGKTIVPFYGVVRQAALPYQNTAYNVQDLTDVPAYYRPTLRIQYQGIDQTYTSDAIYGKRLSITYNAANQPVLKLDGVAVGNPGTAVTTGAATTVNFTVTHNAYVATFANRAFSQQIRGGAGRTFVIANGWGPTGRGLAERYRAIQSELRASGADDASEPVLGSSLALIGAQWIAQTTHSAYVAERLAETSLIHHHQIGIVGYTTSAYVDLPSNMVSIANLAANVDKENAAFLSWAMHTSILESTAVQQMTGVSAVSTVKLLDIASAAGQRIYNATSTNYASAVQPNLAGCGAHLGNFSNYLASGLRLILPARCDLTEGNWSGVGYYAVSSGLWLGAIISDGLSGGVSTANQAAGTLATVTVVSGKEPISWIQATLNMLGDPIDMVQGHFLYEHEDINAGIGAFPQSLGFRRLYSSGLRNQNGPLGRGWTHNFNASAAVNSDGFQAMGQDSALDAVGTLVEQKAAFDLLMDPARPIVKMVAATLGQRWFGDQLIDNTVVVTQGLNAEVFVKLPDGSYNSPPGKSSKLTKNADGTFSHETVNRAVLKFNAAGKAATFTDASGIQATFNYYAGGDLGSVFNSLGRAIYLGYTSGHISSAFNGTTSVTYGYDASGNLASFADTFVRNTTYTYGRPGQMASFSLPSFPGVAAATNTYDSLGRVSSQVSARGKRFDYYLAGSRTEEVGPTGGSRITYLDASGNVLQSRTPAGNWTVSSYDGQGRLLSRMQPEGNATLYAYDDAPCASAEKRCTHNVKTITSVAKPGSGLASLTRSFTYESAFNRVATATDARGKTTTTTYTAQGQPLSVTSPADASGIAPVTSYAYTSYAPSGYPTFYLPTSQSVKTGATNPVVDDTTYSATNKYVPQTRTTDAGTGKLNLSTTFTYDAVGNLTLVDGPRSDVTDTVATTYDSARRPTQTTDAAGKVTRTAYDADGRAIRVAAQAGIHWLTTCTRYNEAGKSVRVWGPALMVNDTSCPTEAAPVTMTDTVYDDLDRPVRTTQMLLAAEGGNRVAETVYNADDTVALIRKAVGSALAQTYVTHTYTPNGQVDTAADAKGNLTVHLYDGHDRLWRTHYPLPAQPGWANANDFEQTTYDANGNAVALARRSGHVITQTWDNLNRLTARNYPAPYAGDSVQYAYDLRGLRTVAQFANGAHATTYAWDNAGRLLGTTSGGKTLAHQYDAAGNRIRTTWPDGFFATTAYDGLNRPSQIRESGSVALASYAYDDLSRRTTATLGNGTTIQRSYDTQGAMSSLKNFLASPSQEVQYSYVRNQVGDLKSVTWSNNLYGWTGATVGSKAYTSDGLNRYTVVAGVGQGYEANANLSGDGTWTYAYDLDNRLRSASKSGTTATLSYDAEGRLRQTSLNGTATNLLYDGTRLIAEYDGSNATVLKRYVHGPGTDEPIVAYDGAGTSNKNWLYTDHLGSVVATANSTGASTGIYSYGPYGEPNTTAATGPRFRYTGQQLVPELGLYYYKARFYSPTLGRFLQTDPIGTKDDQNLYAYVGNNPMNRTDPTGLAYRDAVVLAGKVGSFVGDAWAVSVNAFQNESAADHAMKVLDGLPVEGAVLGAAGAVKSIGGAATSVKSIAGVGEITFQTSHYASRLQTAGVNVVQAESLVAAEVKALSANMTAGAPVFGRMTIEGTLVEYRAYLLPSGMVNIGTIFKVN